MNHSITETPPVDPKSFLIQTTRKGFNFFTDKRIATLHKDICDEFPMEKDCGDFDDNPTTKRLSFAQRNKRIMSWENKYKNSNGSQKWDKLTRNSDWTDRCQKLQRFVKRSRHQINSFRLT